MQPTEREFDWFDLGFLLAGLLMGISVGIVL